MIRSSIHAAGISRCVSIVRYIDPGQPQRARILKGDVGVGILKSGVAEARNPSSRATPWVAVAAIICSPLIDKD
jgi:hypothetical protein